MNYYNVYFSYMHNGKKYQKHFLQKAKNKIDAEEKTILKAKEKFGKIKILKTEESNGFFV